VFAIRELRTRLASKDQVPAEPLRGAFEDHYGGLVRLCSLLTGRRDIAEDLAQEAFVRLAGKIDRLEIDAVGPYLRRIAVNLWKNRLRRMAIELRHRSAAREPAVAGIDVEERDEMWAAVKRLPARQRTCLVLRYYEELSERETAATLGCSIGTVKSQTSKALARLRKELGDVD
jgi:RNA polymerase sigma-70 factor (sigma-E family)